MSKDRAVFRARQWLMSMFTGAVLLTASSCAYYNEPAAPFIGAAGGAGLGAIIGNQVNGGRDQDVWTLGGAITGLALGTTYYLTRQQYDQPYGSYNNNYNTGYSNYNRGYQPPPPANSTYYAPPPNPTYYYSGY